MADWKEIEQLQAAFQQTQLTTSKQRLSERNCIEILAKLQEMKLLDVLHTVDGKEYLTPKQLAREIRDEVYVHGGRVNLVEVQQALNVDFSHVEAKSNELVKSDRSLQMVYGEVIQSSYLDQLAEDINDTLQAVGQVTIAEISKTYDIPGEFLVPELISRIGKLIHGQIDEQNKDTIFTRAFISKHKARVRGLLSATTRPLALAALIADHDLSLKLLFSIVEELIAEGRIKGQIAGGRSEKATFLPSIHTQTQNKWIDNFYAQNNYIEFDAVSRLGISESKSYLKHRLGDENDGPLFLDTLCVGQSLVDRVVSSVEETLSVGEWIDVLTLVPTSFTSVDCNQLLHHIVQQRRKSAGSEELCIFAETIVSSKKFVDSCHKHFIGLINRKAETDAKKASVLALTEEERKVFLNVLSVDPGKKLDKKDDRRKKATEGSGSTKRDFGGAGVGSREMKTKGKDKKRLKWKKEQEKMADEKTSKQQPQAAKFLDVPEIVEVLQDNLPDCPDEFLQELSEHLQKPLTRAYEAAVNSVFLMTTQQQKQQQQREVTKASATSTDSNEDTRRKLKSRKQLEEEVNMLWCNARLFAESFKLFEDEVLATLQKHLLKTTCTEICNVLFTMMAGEFMSRIEIGDKVDQELRLKMLSKFPADLRLSLTQLNNSLNGKLFEDFNDALFKCVTLEVCDVMLKGADKKRDRQVAHGHKISMLKQLEAESDPALSLHLCSMIIFQTVTGTPLNAPGKCVPAIILLLGQYVDKEAHKNILTYQDLVMKKLVLQNKKDSSRDEIEAIEKELSHGIEQIRKLASSTKKQSAN